MAHNRQFHAELYHTLTTFESQVAMAAFRSGCISFTTSRHSHLLLGRPMYHNAQFIVVHKPTIVDISLICLQEDNLYVGLAEMTRAHNAKLFQTGRDHREHLPD